MEQSETFRASSSAPEEAVAGGKMPLCRVLLVEDDYDDQVLAKKRLGRSDQVQEVVCFQNGTELIQYLYDQGFHDRSLWLTIPMVIVLDLNMPQMNGFDVLNELKTDPFLSDIPVLVVTGSQSKEEVDKAISMKADAVFPKPINVAKLQSFFSEGWTWPRKEMWYY